MNSMENSMDIHGVDQEHPRCMTGVHLSEDLPTECPDSALPKRLLLVDLPKSCRKHLGSPQCDLETNHLDSDKSARFFAARQCKREPQHQPCLQQRLFPF